MSEEIEQKELYAQEGDTHYYLAWFSNNEIHVQKSWRPVAGASNAYGITIYYYAGKKRAKAEVEYWTNGWATFGLPMQGSEIAKVSYTSIEQFNEIYNEAKQIFDEEDSIEREAKTVEIVNKVFDLFDEGEEE